MGLRGAVHADDEHVAAFARIVRIWIGAFDQHFVELVQSVDVAGVHTEKNMGLVNVEIHMFFPVVPVYLKGAKRFLMGQEIALGGMDSGRVVQAQVVEIVNHIKIKKRCAVARSAFLDRADDNICRKKAKQFWKFFFSEYLKEHVQLEVGEGANVLFVFLMS